MHINEIMLNKKEIMLSNQRISFTSPVQMSILYFVNKTARVKIISQKALLINNSPYL